MDLELPQPSPPREQLYGIRPEYRSPRLRAKIATAAFALYGAGIVAALALLRDAAHLAREIEAGHKADQVAALATINARGYQIEMISWGLTAVCAVAFCFWTHRVARNACSFGGDVSPGMAVGSHFIPILNLWRPYAALSASWRASGPEADAVRTPALLLIWWIAWLVARYGSRALIPDSPPGPGAWMTHIHMAMASLVLEAIALVLAVAVVWTLTRRQEARAAEPLAPARVL